MQSSDDGVKRVEIGDVIDTPYGTFKVADIERHHFDPGHSHMDLVEVDEQS